MMFTKDSLRGRYAYRNDKGDVASLGRMEFDGKGGLEIRILTNTPCATPAPGCSRDIGNFEASGTYSVNPDGTGVATINFSAPTGPITYDFVIVDANRRGSGALAIEVFSAGRAGGLAGQLIAPTWSRVSGQE
jgi:hypothetical protein